MKTKKFAIILVILSLLIPSIIFADSDWDIVDVARCAALHGTSLDDLKTKISDANEEDKLTYGMCISRVPQYLTNPQVTDITTDPGIVNFLKTLHPLRTCLYINIDELTQDKIYEKAFQEHGLPLETIKAIDQAGNDNCRIDTNNEKCKQKIEEEKIANHGGTIAKIQSEKYGCYGTSTSPKTLQQYLEGDRGNTANQRVDVFDQRTGLIASKGQLDKLTNIAKAQGGPVIGFFNFIIDYLVSIVFVLCMASLIYGGYNLIFSGFDQDMAEKGKKAIQYAIYGFLFIMLSYTIVLLVQSIF